MSDQDLQERAIEYAKSVGISLDLTTPLGHGTDGSVWKSNMQTAVKALYNERNYSVEVECYQRFEENKVANLQGFAIPQLMGFNDDLLVIEMRIVTPPFILDFAKSWLDHPAEFSVEQWADWDEECRDRFEDRWPQVQSLLSSLEKYGIYYYDAKPANIMFPDSPGE